MNVQNLFLFYTVLVDAAAALDVEVPIQLVDPYEDDLRTGSENDKYPRCMPLSSQLSNVFYTDWPEDHWTRFRSAPRGKYKSEERASNRVYGKHL